MTLERLAPLVALLPHATLEVGIGLETADDSLRERVLRKGFSFDTFERAASLLHESGAALLAYVFVKPPGLSEEQALRDATETVTAIAALRDRLSASGRPFQVRAALQPAFVARGTRLEKEHVAGQYEVPSLWTVRDVVLATHPLLPLQVALWDEGLADGRVARGCSACTPKLREALGRFNAAGETAALESVVCSSCRPPGGPLASGGSVFIEVAEHPGGPVTRGLGGAGISQRAQETFEQALARRSRNQPELPGASTANFTVGLTWRREGKR